MRSCPFTVMVCLIFSVVSVGLADAESHDFIHVNVITPHNTSDGHILGSNFRKAVSSEPVLFKQASARRVGPTYAPPLMASPIMKCKPPLCPPRPACAPVCRTCCMLPLRCAGQWELGTQVFFAQIRGTFQFPGVVSGVPASEVTFHDVGIDPTATLLEYSATYQFAPRWAVYYSIMPIELDGSRTAERSFWYGLWFYPAGTRINATWKFTYQRLGLMYQPILNPQVQVSLFTGWTFNDQQLRLRSEICAGQGSTLNRTRNMVNSGIQVQKCLRTLPNGATLACDNRAEIIWLDGTVGEDIQAGMRFSVPLGFGRWGYARGGYRYLNFTESRDDLRLDSTFQGGFVEGGVIF
jgi:hypothetical protein